MSEKPTQSVSEQIAHLPAQILLSLARNPSSSPEYMKAAVALLHEKGYPEANHPELKMVLADIKKEREARNEVEAIVETAIEEPLHTGALQASVTTKTMQTEPVIRNAAALSEDALSEPAFEKQAKK